MGRNYILQKILLLSSPFWAICHYSDPSPWYSHPCVDPSHVVSASPIPSSRMWQQWSQVISEEGYKDTGFCLSWIACSLGSQLPCWQACMASVNSHVSELSWKWILQPWPSWELKCYFERLRARTTQISCSLLSEMVWNNKYLFY